MSITTTSAEYKKLRAFLNPAIKGNTTDAILNALASGPAAFLVNSVDAVNDQLYIATASSNYLDERLAEYGITRPPELGLSDDIFRQIGIQVKNRKQVRDLIDQLLLAIFGAEFVEASSSSAAFEPYALEDGDTLIVNFDQNQTISVQFSAGQFGSIAAATAQEVADAISQYLNANGYPGSAIAKNDGNGGYVEILSDTIGPRSSVTILGGRAQNELLFASPVPAGGNQSTQWTIANSGEYQRYTWSGGADPQIGKLQAGYYVNIYGGGFTSSTNVGSFTIVDAVGGTVNEAYFEISNPLGTTGIVTEGVDSAVLFYNPQRKTLSSMSSYAAVYQTEARMLQIFLPAATQVIRRSRIGSAHLHYPPMGTFTLNAQPVPGDSFSITSATTLTAGTNFVIGADIPTTCQNMVAAINELEGLIAIFNSTNVVSVYQTDASLTLTMTYAGSQAIAGSGLIGDPVSLQPNQQGPYVYDLTQPFTISAVNTVLTETVDNTTSKVITVKDAANFPNSQGYLIFEYGTDLQEGPVPYIARPSDGTLLISPAYSIQNQHLAGATVTYIESKSPVSLATDGSDYEAFITGVADGREYAETLIQSVVATGINIVFTILYPGGEGLGKWQDPTYTEIVEVWS